MASSSANGMPLDQHVSHTSGQHPVRVGSALDSDRHVSKVVPERGAAGGSLGVASPSAVATAAAFAAGGHHPDSGIFAQQIQRLRAHLQSVVQGVREVAQSLDEPHTLIANVRDQLQSRHDASTRRNSLSIGPYGSVSSSLVLAQSSSLARSSTGGLGPFRAAIPEDSGFEAGALAPAGPGEDAFLYDPNPDSAGGRPSVKARVAAVERRSRSGGSGGGFLEAHPLLTMSPSLLPAVLERSSSAGAADTRPRVGGGQEGEGAVREERRGDTGARAASLDSGIRNTGAATGVRAGAEASGRGELPLSSSDVIVDGPGIAAAPTANNPASDPVLGSSGTQASPPRSLSADGSGPESTAVTAAAAAANLSSLSSPATFEGMSRVSDAAALVAPVGDTDPATPPQPPLPGLDAATAAYLAAHPETLRELWTLRARCRAQEAELESMVKQLSTKNAQLDQAQTCVQHKDQELGAITRRLTGVLGKLQTYQAVHHHNHHNHQPQDHQQQQQHPRDLQGARRSPGRGASAASSQGGSPSSHAIRAAVSDGGWGSSEGGSSVAGAAAPEAGEPCSPPHAPVSVASARAQLLARFNEADGATTSRGGASSSGNRAASPFDTVPGGSLPLSTPQNPILASRRSSSFRPAGIHQTSSLQADERSVEVSLPPPPTPPSVVPGGELASAAPGFGGQEQQQQQAGAAAVATADRESGERHGAGGAEATGEQVTVRGQEEEQRVPLPSGAAAGAELGSHGVVVSARRTAVSRPSAAAAAAAALGLDRRAGTGMAAGPATQSAAAGRRRSVLSRVLLAAPSLACVALLLRDSAIRQGLEQLRRNALKGGAPGRRSSSPSRRVVEAAVASARSAPLDVNSSWMTQPGARKGGSGSRGKASAAPSSTEEPFESTFSRECKAKWCSIVRPPSNPAVIYY